MVDWKAIGGGVVVFLGVFPIALRGVTMRWGDATFWLVLTAAVPGALVTGYLKGGLTDGLRYGFVTGCGSAVVLTTGFAYLFELSRSGAAVGLLVVALLDGLFILESVVAGAFGGFLASRRAT